MSVLLIQDEPVEPSPRSRPFRSAAGLKRELITLSLAMPECELTALDEAVGEAGTSRSAVIREAVRLWLKRR